MKPKRLAATLSTCAILRMLGLRTPLAQTRL